MGRGAHLGNPYLRRRKWIEVRFRSLLPDVQRIHTDQGHKCGMPFGLQLESSEDTQDNGL